MKPAWSQRMIPLSEGLKRKSFYFFEIEDKINDFRLTPHWNFTHIPQDANDKPRQFRVKHYGPIDATYTQRLRTELEIKATEIDRARISRAEQV